MVVGRERSDGCIERRGMKMLQAPTPTAIKPAPSSMNATRREAGSGWRRSVMVDRLLSRLSSRIGTLLCLVSTLLAQVPPRTTR